VLPLAGPLVTELTHHLFPEACRFSHDVIQPVEHLLEVL